MPFFITLKGVITDKDNKIASETADYTLFDLSKLYSFDHVLVYGIVPRKLIDEGNTNFRIAGRYAYHKVAFSLSNGWKRSIILNDSEYDRLIEHMKEAGFISEPKKNKNKKSAKILKLVVDSNKDSEKEID